MTVYEWVSLLLTLLVFPFAGYFFKRNERLHEETQKTQALQDIQLTRHEEQIKNLQEWYPRAAKNRG